MSNFSMNSGSMKTEYTKTLSDYVANLTYDDIIRICGERGYSYTTRTDGLAYETYVEIQVENGRTVAFAWDGFGVEEISGVPVSFVIW